MKSSKDTKTDGENPKMKVSKSKNNGNYTPPLNIKGCQITMEKGSQNNRKYTGITFHIFSSNNYIYNPIIVRVGLNLPQEPTSTMTITYLQK